MALWRSAVAVHLLAAGLCPLWAAPLVCAGQVQTGTALPVITALPVSAAAKLAAQGRTTGTRHALVLFARFADEPETPVPAWASALLDPDRPGTFAHYYDAMSSGRLRVRGGPGPGSGAE